MGVEALGRLTGMLDLLYLDENKTEVLGGTPLAEASLS